MTCQTISLLHAGREWYPINNRNRNRQELCKIPFCSGILHSSPCCLTWMWCVACAWCARLFYCSWRTPWLRLKGLKVGQTMRSRAHRLTLARWARSGKARRKTPGLSPKMQARQRYPSRTCRTSRTRGTGCRTSSWLRGAKASLPASEADWIGSEHLADWAATQAEVPQGHSTTQLQ